MGSPFRSEWMADQHRAGIEIWQGSISELNEECQRYQCFAFISTKSCRLQETEEWGNNYSYFRRILLRTEREGKKQVKFFLFETDEFDPTIIFYNGEKVIEDVLEFVHDKNPEDLKWAEDQGISYLMDAIGEEELDVPQRSSDLSDWMKLYKKEGARFLGELDNCMKLGTSFALIIDKSGTKKDQSEEDKMENLKFFLDRTEESKDGNYKCLILEILPVNEERKVNFTIQRYRHNECVSRDVVDAWHKLTNSEAKTASGSQIDNTINLYNWVEDLVELGATNLGILDRRFCNFRNSYVLFFETVAKSNEQDQDSKRDNLKLFKKLLEKKESNLDFLIIGFDLNEEDKQTITVQQHKNGSCVCTDMLKKQRISRQVPEQINNEQTPNRMEDDDEEQETELSRSFNEIVNLNNQTIMPTTESNKIKLINNLTSVLDSKTSRFVNFSAIPLPESWKTAFLERGAKYEQVNEKYEDFLKDGTIFLMEQTENPQTSDEQKKVLQAFLYCLNERNSEPSINFRMIKIGDFIPSTQSQIRLSLQQFTDDVCISKSLLDEDKKSNLAKCTGTIEEITDDPPKRALSKVRCPCDKIAANSSLVWKCADCQKEIFYGYDGYFYCSCGRSLFTSFWFKCSQECHGPMYLPYQDKKMLRKKLDSLTPNKSLNILLLGETGVGKSTMINSLANYAAFGTLEKAKISNLKVLIPTSFTVTDQNYEEQTIQLGYNENEAFGEGQSSTQACRNFKFYYGVNDVNLIDTPGIGDTRGSLKDNENFEEILNFISNFDTIDGIFILLKPNESRLTIVFRYCVEGLLAQLHKNASRNIAFLFTNCRSTFYRPGESLNPLKTLLKKIKDNPPHVNLIAEHRNIYCFDNEAFRFLVANQQGIEYQEEDKKNFASSWDKSVAELSRIIDFVKGLPPHDVKDTLTINGARSMIINLTKPLGDVTRNLSANIAAIEDQEKEIKLAGEDIDKLKQALYVPTVILEIENKADPRTVCTSETCVEVINNGNGNQTHYKTVCCSPCSEVLVRANLVNNAELATCKVMNNEVCTKCNCRWEKHMHILYETKQVNSNRVDENVKLKLNTEEERKRVIEKVMKKLQEEKNKHIREKDIITKSSAKFAKFLANNAITPYNDAAKDYLDYIIQTERSLAVNDPSKKQLIEELTKTQEAYIEEKNILEECIKNKDSFGIKNGKITPEDITETVNQLKELGHSGVAITKMLLITEDSKKAATENQSLFKQFGNLIRKTGKGVKNVINYCFSSSKKKQETKKPKHLKRRNECEVDLDEDSEWVSLPNKFQSAP